MMRRLLIALVLVLCVGFAPREAKAGTLWHVEMGVDLSAVIIGYCASGHPIYHGHKHCHFNHVHARHAHWPACGHWHSVPVATRSVWYRAYAPHYWYVHHRPSVVVASHQPATRVVHASSSRAHAHHRRAHRR